MAIILRKSGQKRDGEDKRKQLYTWSGCGKVIILTLVTVLPNIGSEPQPDYSRFSAPKMQDLASMPFGSDNEAADFLHNNPEYQDVSNGDLLGALFSSEDRKARHENDKLKGLPPAPDPEYQSILDQRKKDEKAREVVKKRRDKITKETEDYAKAKAERAAKIQQKRKEREAARKNPNSKDKSPTKVSTLGNSVGMAGGKGGAGTATVGSIWRHEDKNIKGGEGGANPKHDLTSKDLAFAKDKGKNMGFYQAVVDSAKAAKADTAEAAMAGAANAFTGDVEADDLDKDAEELGLEEGDLTDLIDSGLQDDIAGAINDDVNEQTKNEEEKVQNTSDELNANCLNKKGEFSWTCFWATLGTNFASSLASGLSSCITSGCWNNWGNGVSKADQKWMEQMGLHNINGTWFDGEGHILQNPNSGNNGGGSNGGGNGGNH